MRETFTSLQTIAHDATQTVSTDTAINTFLKKEINRAYRLTQAELDNFTTQIVKTTTTVADQQFYHKPPDVVTIESVVVTIGDVDYTCRPLSSQRIWDEMNAVTFSGNAFPSVFFQRQNDFGIYPTPQDAYSMKMTYIPRYPDMANADYTTGTVTATNNSAAIVGSGTVFTAAMVDRWISLDNDGSWYRISAFTDSTNITIDNVYQGTTAAGATFTIGESPEIPEEIQEILPWKAAAAFFIQRRKDSGQAAIWSNMFYTGDAQNSSRDLAKAAGGLLGAKKRYAARASTGIAHRNRRNRRNFWVDRAWGTTITG